MTALITGNKTATAAERGPDLYASPYAALPPLLAAERAYLPKTLWEPSCGNGALVVPLRNRGFKVAATDLYSWGCPDSVGGVDFFSPLAEACRPQEPFGIVTNPPFGGVEEYIERAVGLAPYVALLLRLAFLESEGRLHWWKQVGLRRVHLISDRLPMMHRHGWEGAKLTTSGMAFGWYVFEPNKRPRNGVSLSWWSWKETSRKFPQMLDDDPPMAKDQLGLFDRPLDADSVPAHQ